MRKQTITPYMRYSNFTDCQQVPVLNTKFLKTGILKICRNAKSRAPATLMGLGFIFLMANGCSSTPVQASSQSTSAVHRTSNPNTSHRGNDSIQERLQKQYLAWKGVPYREGGYNKRGVDCSGFVQITFKRALGLNVPRTTQRLMEIAKPISRQQLSIGDLVFFKTGFSKHHVGIYIGKDQFIHASTSQGVTKSNLKSIYWSKHYWKSARILNI